MRVLNQGRTVVNALPDKSAAAIEFNNDERNFIRSDSGSLSEGW
jgi:hypothetical protein